MSWFRGFVIRIVEWIAYFGILATTYAGVVFAGTEAGTQMFTAALSLPFELQVKDVSPLLGGIAGFLTGASTFGLILTLIDIRERFRREGLPEG